SPNGAIDAAWTLVDALNLYITEQEPWKVAKDEAEAGQGGRLATILVTAAEGLRTLAVLLNPVMPKAAGALWDSLGAADYLGELDAQPVADSGRFGQLKAGTTVTKGDALFPRLVEVEEA